MGKKVELRYKKRDSFKKRESTRLALVSSSLYGSPNLTELIDDREVVPRVCEIEHFQEKRNTNE